MQHCPYAFVCSRSELSGVLGYVRSRSQVKSEYSGRCSLTLKFSLERPRFEIETG